MDLNKLWCYFIGWIFTSSYCKIRNGTRMVNKVNNGNFDNYDYNEGLTGVKTFGGTKRTRKIKGKRTMKRKRRKMHKKNA